MASSRVSRIRRLREAHPRLRTARAVLWAFCGALVALYVFFALLGGVTPSEAKAATVVVGALALVWAVRYWRLVSARGNASPYRDRERRGF